MVSKVEGIKALIFDRFSWILEPKLGAKTDQKSFQEGIEKHDEKRTQHKTPRSQSLAWPGGMHGALGENKDGVERTGE